MVPRGQVLAEFLAVQAGGPVKDPEDIILDYQKVFVLDSSPFFKDGLNLYFRITFQFHWAIIEIGMLSVKKIILI